MGRVIIVVSLLLLVAGVVFVLVADVGGLRTRLMRSETLAPPVSNTTANQPEKVRTPQVQRTNFHDWLLLCHSQQSQRNCALVQQHVSGDTKIFVFAVTMRLGEQGTIEADFTTPSNILLEPGLSLNLDEAAPLILPFIRCSTSQCVAAASIDRSLLDRLSRAKKLSASFQTATGQEFKVDISKNGLSRGLAALHVYAD